jgi:ferredoxin
MSFSTGIYRGRPEINPNKCDGCGGCVALCPPHALRIVEEANIRKIELSLANCIFCGRCSEICPEGAIVLVNKPESPSYKVTSIKEVELNLLRCEMCNRIIAPTKAIHKIEELKKALMLSDEYIKRNTIYCDRCKRLITSQVLTHIV